MMAKILEWPVSVVSAVLFSFYWPVDISCSCFSIWLHDSDFSAHQYIYIPFVINTHMHFRDQFSSSQLQPPPCWLSGLYRWECRSFDPLCLAVFCLPPCTRQHSLSSSKTNLALQFSVFILPFPISPSPACICSTLSAHLSKRTPLPAPVCWCRGEVKGVSHSEEEPAALFYTVPHRVL